jgi:hypothetical protein
MAKKDELNENERMIVDNALRAYSNEFKKRVKKVKGNCFFGPNYIETMSRDIRIKLKLPMNEDPSYVEGQDAFADLFHVKSSK